MPAGSKAGTRARSGARKLLLQALYQWQLGRQPCQELHQQFAADPEFPRADAGYFQEGLQAVCGDAVVLDLQIARFSDIEPARLDPVEHAALYLGMWELLHRPDIPYRVIINESVELVKRFGATDGYKFVNAVLDKASREHRSVERGAVA